MIPTSIDGTDITGATIDGTDVQEITVDGDTVFTAGPQPPDQANLVFQMDASQESLSNNQTTSTVTDFSGNGNDFSGDSIIFKTNQINGLPAFEFDDDSLTNSQTLSTPCVVAFVAEFTANNQQHRVWGHANNNDTVVDIDTGQFFNGIDLKFNGGSGFSRTTALNTYEIFVADYVSGTSEMTINGTLAGTQNTPGGSVTNLNLGTADQDNSRGLQGNMSELLIYDTSTSVSDITTYLQDKYNL